MPTCTSRSLPMETLSRQTSSESATELLQIPGLSQAVQAYESHKAEHQDSSSRQSAPVTAQSAETLSWADLPDSLLELLFVKFVQGRSRTGGHQDEGHQDFCKVRSVVTRSSGKITDSLSCDRILCLQNENYWKKLQAVVGLTTVCRSWRQAGQLSLFHPGRPWVGPADYVHPLQLFTRVCSHCCSEGSLRMIAAQPCKLRNT